MNLTDGDIKLIRNEVIAKIFDKEVKELQYLLEKLK